MLLAHKREAHLSFEKGLVIIHLLKLKKINMCLERCHGVLSFDLFFFFDKQRELNEIGLTKQPRKEYTGCIQQVPQDL